MRIANRSVQIFPEIPPEISSRLIPTASTLALLGALTVSLAGCSGGRDEPIATASGKVTHAGKPVPAGSFLNLEDRAKGVSTSVQIGEGGAYSLPESAQLPAGTYAVAVTPPSASGEVSQAEYDKMMSGAAAPPKATNFPVPEQFRSVATSGKTVELKEGENAIDIDFGK